MAVINAYTREVIPLATVNMEMNSRMDNNMTYPWGIINYLEKYGIKSSCKILKFKKRLSEGKPLIMLNDLDGVLHYFTLLGFNNANEFYIYDSMKPVKIVNDKKMTIDSNGDKPGNITLDSLTLLTRWRNGSFKGINYLIIVPADSI